MRAALVQCDVTTGDLAGNATGIIAACRTAAEKGASLCLAPYEALCGPNADFFVRLPDFEENCRQTALHMASELDAGIALICGHPFIKNSALLIANGQTMEVDDLFYWHGQAFTFAKKTGQNAFGMYMPIELSIHAAPFAPGAQAQREQSLARAALGHTAWQLAVNLVGGYEGEIYNGQSMAFNPEGKIFARGPAFAEEIIVVDMEERQAGIIVPDCQDANEAIWRALVLGTADFVRKAGARQALLGLSGGMDSALVACIAAEALGPANVTGILMPSPWSSEASVSDSLELAQNLGIDTITIPLEGPLQAIESSLAPVYDKYEALPGDLTHENLQARLRGLLLMAVANRSGALVLNTGNKSELAMGYCTLYGDTVGAVAVLGDIFKTEVYALAKWYCDMRGKMIIPQNIFDKAPSAELRPNQKDTDSLPPYDELDPLLEKLLNNKEKADESQMLADVRKRFVANRFKARQYPPLLLVSGMPMPK